MTGQTDVQKRQTRRIRTRTHLSVHHTKAVAREAHQGVGRPPWSVKPGQPPEQVHFHGRFDLIQVGLASFHP
jgi:hypothetical protein